MSTPARRWPWFACAAGLFASGLAAGITTCLWWLPCRGQMLLGTPVGPVSSNDSLSPACAARVNDGTPFPLPAPAARETPWLLELSTVTVLLAALAWLILVLGLRLHRTITATGMMVAGLLAAVALAGLATAHGLDDANLGLLLLLAVNVVGLIAVVVIALDERGWRLAGLLGVVAVVSSFGLSGVLSDLWAMSLWSSINWDAPPGSGYLTAAVLVLGALLTAAVGLIGPVGDDAPDADNSGKGDVTADQVAVSHGRQV